MSLIAGLQNAGMLALLRPSLLSLALAGCAGPSAPPAEVDAAAVEVDAAAIDASLACVTPAGESGDCMPTASCAGIADHVSIAHACPGPIDIQCCVITPSVAHNPAVPAGYKLMAQAQVTPEMTTWAVDILHDPTTYPMYATTTRRIRVYGPSSVR